MIRITKKWFSGGDTPKQLRLRFSAAERRVLRRRAYVRPSEWMARYLFLPGDGGRLFRADFGDCPYLADVVDASFYESVQEVVGQAVPQWGKSTVMYGCLAYAADLRPGPAMIVFPAEADTRDEFSGRAKRIFRNCPALAGYLTGKDDDFSATGIRLRHMTITGSWPTARKLARKPIAYVGLDEENKTTAVAIGGETGVKRLLEDRQRRYEHLRKMWRLCSPTVESGSITVAIEEECHLRFHWYVKCPECGKYQRFVYDKAHFQWDKGIRTPKEMERQENRAKVWYVCDGCGVHWDEAARVAAIRAGEWRDAEHGLSLWVALEAHRPLKIGFYGTALMSPFIPMWRAAATFLATLNGNLDALKHWKNAYEGVPWVIKERVRKAARILALRDERPRGKVPGGGRVACLTASADTQADGFWFQIMAWGYGEEAPGWVVRQDFVFDFDTLKRVFWSDVYADAEGNVYPVQLAMIDSGGSKGRTAEVYDFCIANRGRVFPTKGASHEMAQAYKRSNLEYFPGTGKQKPIPGGLVLFLVNTQYFKDNLATKLSVAPDNPNAIRFDAEMTEDEAEHFVSEYVNDKGKWDHKDGAKNHLWDCTVINMVARDVRGVRYWSRPEPDTDPAPAAVEKAVPAGGWVRPSGGSGWLRR